MLNNNGNYASNETPNDMDSPLNRSKSEPVNLSHNLDNFTKIMQEAVSTSSEYCDSQTLSSFRQSSMTLQPQLYPIQAYQTVGNLSSFLSPKSSFIHENVIQDYRTTVSSIPKSDHHPNMLNLHKNKQLKYSTGIQEMSEEETISMKNYPINIPQIPTRIYQKSSSFNKIDRKTEFVNTVSSNDIPLNRIGVFQKIFSPGTNNIQNSLNEDIKTSSNNSWKAPSVEENELDVPYNLSQSSSQINTVITPKSPLHSDESNRFSPIQNKNSINCSDTIRTYLTEGKRKSLEKTVRLIESILIRSTNNIIKQEIVEENSTNSDPLALSPRSNTDQNVSDNLTDSDDEALIKKVFKQKNRNTRSPSKKIQSQRRSHVTECETQVQVRRRLQSEQSVEVVVKVEETNSCDLESVNPFLRDCNGTLNSDKTVVGMEYSVEEASKVINNGTNSSSCFECPYCSLLIVHPKRFLIHTKWHTFGLINEKRAEMARERETIIKERRLARSNQRSIETEATGTEEEKYPCKDCDKIFRTKSSLKGHRQKFHLSQEQECKICLVTVVGVKALRDHLTIHEDKATGGHQCPKCSKRFKYRHSLAKHIGTHLEKTHSCPECSKMFGSEQLVKLHMKTHERAARGTTHHCSFCGKGFYEPYNLNVHERTHRNDKPFKCEICGSCFVTNSSLKRHVKVSHSASGAKPYVCQICRKCFSTESIRDRHELRVHSDQNHFPCPCPLCPKRYMKTKDLRNHMYKMHPKDKIKTATIEIEVEPLSS